MLARAIYTRTIQFQFVLQHSLLLLLNCISSHSSFCYRSWPSLYNFRFCPVQHSKLKIGFLWTVNMRNHDVVNKISPVQQSRLTINQVLLRQANNIRAYCCCLHTTIIIPRPLLLHRQNLRVSAQLSRYELFQSS